MSAGSMCKMRYNLERAQNAHYVACAFYGIKLYVGKQFPCALKVIQSFVRSRRCYEKPN